MKDFEDKYKNLDVVFKIRIEDIIKFQIRIVKLENEKKELREVGLYEEGS